MAKAWLDPTDPLGADLSTVLGSVVRLLTVARTKRVPIVFTRMIYDDPATQLTEVAKRKKPHLLGLQRGSPRCDLADELQRREAEPLIEKPSNSAFYATSLRALLNSLEVDTLVITGCSTSGCIRSTCEDAFDEGFRVIVPAEAVGDRSPSAHAANLSDIDARYGDVVPITEALRKLR